MHQQRWECRKRAAQYVLLLACVVPAISLCHFDHASADVRSRGAAPKPAAARPVAPVGARAIGGPHAAPGAPHAAGARTGLVPPGGPAFGHPAGVMSGQPRPNGPGHGAEHGLGRGPEHGQGHSVEHGPGHGLEHGPSGVGAGHALPHGPAMIGRPALNAIARNGLPVRPFPGDAGFSGVPPSGEARFVSNEMVVHVGADVSPQALNAAAQRLGLTAIGSRDLSLSGGRLMHFRLPDGRPVADAVRALEAEKLGIAQPNYVFQLQQDARAAVPFRGDPAQYVVDKLHLLNAHGIASGTNVPVAIIDSRVDTAHPDLAGSIAGQFDAVTAADKPDEHGTGMTGAIVAHGRLLGVAPQARILAIHAFSPDAQHPQQATTQSIVAGIDWAIAKGARIINMSFAGPYDPLLQLALKKAHDKGVVLIAAAGNMGPQSPPLYPAADDNVIGPGGRKPKVPVSVTWGVFRGPYG